MSEQHPEPDPEADRGSEDRVGESLRTAVSRTLAATAGSASEGGQRARDLLDEVARRGEVARAELGRRGAAARDEVVRRTDAAREGVSRRTDAARDDLTRRSEEAGARLAEALAELKLSDREPPEALAERLAAVERRLDELERRIGAGSADRGTTAAPERHSNPEVEVEPSPRDADSQADSDG